MRHGEILAMPDAQLRDPALPQRIEGGNMGRRVWTYWQGVSGLVTPREPGLLVYGDGGALDHGPEEMWAIRYTPSGAYWERWWGCEGDEGETYAPSLVRTPDSWPEDRRWLMGYSGTMRSTSGQRRRVWLGLAWIADLAYEQWDRRLVIPWGGTGPSGGVWCVALVVRDGEVIAIGRDSTYPVGQMHRRYRVQPDLSYEDLGPIVLEGAAPAAWCNDGMVLGDGRLVMVEGGNPGTHATQPRLVEYISEGADWSLVKPSGRTWAHPDSTLRTFDGGYLRDELGHISLEDVVFANWSDGRGPGKRGSWGVQWWAGDGTTTQATISQLRTPPLAVEVR